MDKKFPLDKLMNYNLGRFGYLVAGMLLFTSASGFVGRKGENKFSFPENVFQGNYASGIEAVAVKVMSEDELFVERMKDPEQLFFRLVNYVPDTTSLSRIDSSLALSVGEKIGRYGPILEKVRQKVGIPSEFGLGKLASESGGDSLAVSNKKAIGPFQITEETYATLRRQVSYDVNKINELVKKKDISQSALDSVVNGTLFDYVSIKSRGQDGIFSRIVKGIKDETAANDYLMHRIPLALVVMREYGGKVPFDGKSVRSTLFNPEKSAHVFGLVTWSNVLKNYALDLSLQKKVFGTFDYMRTNLSKEIVTSSYIGGPGLSMAMLEKAYPKKNPLDSEGRNTLYVFGPENVSYHFGSRMPASVREYSGRVWRLTNYFTNGLDYAQGSFVSSNVGNYGASEVSVLGKGFSSKFENVGARL